MVSSKRRRTHWAYWRLLSQLVFMCLALLWGNLSENYSHWAAATSLHAWLKEHNVPGLYGKFGTGQTHFPSIRRCGGKSTTTVHTVIRTVHKRSWTMYGHIHGCTRAGCTCQIWDELPCERLRPSSMHTSHLIVLYHGCFPCCSYQIAKGRK